MIDFREILGRLDFGTTTGRDVTFSPVEAWLLREHMRLLMGGPWEQPREELDDGG